MASKPVIAVTLGSRELPGMLHWRAMFEGLQECGAIPFGIDCGTAPLAMADLIGQVDGVMISGGADVDPRLYGGDPGDPVVGEVNPVRDANEIAAFEAAWALKLPTLAVCRGAQLVNAVRGGTLYADLERDFGSKIAHRLGEEALLRNAHQVNLDAGSRLAGWMQTAEAVNVNSQHHQGIRTLADGFVVAARATDGLVEAYESVTQEFTAIQWHPEISWQTDEFARCLLSGFVESCVAPVPAY